MKTTDRNGYAPSIMQEDTNCCYLCGCSNTKLDRHEPWGGALRQKSKRLGLWVTVCHNPCHMYGPNSIERDPEVALRLRQEAEEAALEQFGWTIPDWVREFHKNVLDVEWEW